MLYRQSVGASMLVRSASKLTFGSGSLKSGRNGLKFGRIQFSGFSSSNKNDDNNEKQINKKLHEEYSGLFPRVAAASTILENAKPEFEKVKKKSIWYATGDKSPPDTIARQLVVFADLQNPLLKKYDFDPEDFLIGAKHAIEYIKGIIVGRHLYDYFQRLNDAPIEPEGRADIGIDAEETIKPEYAAVLAGTEDAVNVESEDNTKTENKVNSEPLVDEATQAIEVLKLNCHPSVYNHVVKMYKRMNTMFKMTSSAANIVISNIDNVNGAMLPKKHPFEHDEVTVSVDRIAIVRAYTDIVEAPEDVEEDEEVAGVYENGEDGGDVYNAADLHMEYPIGSVVVTVRVVAHVTYTSSKSVDSLAHVVMFRGCVSGTDNAELDWKIVEMN